MWTLDCEAQLGAGLTEGNLIRSDIASYGHGQIGDCTLKGKSQLIWKHGERSWSRGHENIIANVK